MATVQELVIENPDVITQKNLVDRRRREVREYVRMARDNLLTVRNSKKIHKEFLDPELITIEEYLENMESNVSQSIAHYIKREKRSSENAIKSYHRDYVALRKKVDAYRKSLDQAREKLEFLIKNSTNWRFNIDEIRDILKNYEHVDISRTYLLESGDRNRPVLQVRFKNLRCTPDTNPYVNLVDKNFKLNLVNALMYLDNNQIYFKRASTVAPEPTGFTSGRRVHPHILGNDTPCMGGFLDAYAGARSEYDIETMVGVAQIFLEHANPDDDAGKHWPKWMLYHANGAKGNLNLLNDCRAHELEGYVYFGRRNQDGTYTIPVVEDYELQLHRLGREEAVNLLKHLQSKK